ncbi:MAG: hypothetical protein AAGG02_19100, partial [Cyanobacteria bacterium P01_H01_bin.15]
QIEGTAFWTGQRHELSADRMHGEVGNLAQTRKFAVQSRVQDSRDAEWDEFARADKENLSAEQANIWDRAVPMFRSRPDADGELQRGTRRGSEERMPDRQRFASPEHYQTGADQLKNN